MEKNTKDFPVKWTQIKYQGIFHSNLKAISIFWSTLLKGISFIKLKLTSFFNARYPTVSLRGPVQTLRRGAERRVLFLGNYRLVLPIWVDFIILVWIANCGLKAHFAILNLLCNSDVFVILWRLCHSEMNFSFWDEFVILGWICLNLSFWNEFIILGWLCHSGQNLSLRPELLLWASVILGHVYNSGLTLSFWAEFVVLGWICHSRLNLTRLFIFAGMPVLNQSSWEKIVDLGFIWNWWILLPWEMFPLFSSLYLREDDICEFRALGPTGAQGAHKDKILQKVNSSFSQEFQNEKISASYFEIVNMKAISGVSIKLFVLRLHG